MKQKSLFGVDEISNQIKLGPGLVLEINRLKQKATLYRKSTFVKTINLLDNVEKRLFTVEIAELGANITSLASGLGITRQTVYNYLDIKKYYGLEGLIHSYSSSNSDNLRQQRKNHSHKRHQGNKAKQVSELRKKEKQAREELKENQSSFNFSSNYEHNIEQKELPFSEEHDWKFSRYAGICTYLIPMVTEWKWLQLVMRYFGSAYKIFMVFLLMAGRNIRSIEQLKNVRLREAGIALGVKRVPSKPKVWEWFYIVCEQGISSFIKRDYFRHQLRSGLVGFWMWFTDGHLLPYTGKEKVHYSYNTQTRMVCPGQTNFVTCDESGRIVDFEIQEGKGDLRGRIKQLPQEWINEIPSAAVQVFDREGDGVGFFSRLVKNNCAFVTWEKNVDTKKLFSLDDSLFIKDLTYNDKCYSLFEEDKKLTYKPDNSGAKKHEFNLRRIYLWNKSSKRRACGLAYSADKQMSTKDCAIAILSRWGASENTFKHLGVRHPFHYHPGFKLTASENQQIANPEVKEKQKIIDQLNRGLNKLYKKLAISKESLNKDGTVRQNSIREQLKSLVATEQEALKLLKQEKKQLPKRVDVSTLENYKSFKKIDNEGKNLFDFVTCSVWNARKQLIDWLRPYYLQENELVDLFYAITECHGWIKSTKKEVIFRLEPLQQHKRRVAQEKLCRKLTQLGAQTPTGKWLKIEVGESPL